MIAPKKPQHVRYNKVQVVDVHVNVDQEVIQITEDKLRLILKDYLTCISQSGGWLTPFGILLSIIMTFCTAKFDSFMGLGSEFWKSFFSILGLASLTWLIYCLKNRNNALSIDQFVDKIKNKF